MEKLELPFQTTLEQSYKDYPRFTLNGKEYIVTNCTKENASTTEHYILKDPLGEIADTYYTTEYGKRMDNERRLMKSSLSRYIESHTIERYLTPNAWQEHTKKCAIEFINNPLGWFTILGQSGSGKTHICNAIAIQLMRNGKRLEYMLWLDEINKVKFNMQENDQFVKRFGEVDVLYIDDFLKTKNDVAPSDSEIRLAYQILDARYRRGLVTIISSEKSVQDLKDYDIAVYGRIAEMSGTNLLSVGKSDLRNWRENKGAIE